MDLCSSNTRNSRRKVTPGFQEPKICNFLLFLVSLTLCLYSFILDRKPVFTCEMRAQNKHFEPPRSLLFYIGDLNILISDLIGFMFREYWNKEGNIFWVVTILLIFITQNNGFHVIFIHITVPYSYSSSLPFPAPPL